MSIHILVPQERLVGLLKNAKQAKLSALFVQDQPWAEEYEVFCKELDSLMETPEGLATALGCLYWAGDEEGSFLGPLGCLGPATENSTSEL